MQNFLITLLLFGSMEVISKPLMTIIDPFLLTFYRFVAASAVLILYLVLTGEIGKLKKIPRPRLIGLLLLGVLNGFVAMSLLQVAVKYGNAASAAVIFCSNPLFVYLLQVVSRAEPVSWRKICGLICGIVGIILIMFGHGLTLSGGAVAALFAAITFALFQVSNKKAVQGISPYIANALSFTGALPAYLLYFAITSSSLTLPYSIWQMDNLWRFIYLSLFVSALGYITFIKTVQQMSALSASVIFLLKPAVATLLAFFLLSEIPGWNFYGGLALSLTGSLLTLNVRWNRRWFWQKVQ